MESLRVETESTFRMLYDESYCQIYRIAYGMLRNEHDAWDVLQNVYIKALLKSDSLRDPSKIKGWMVQITYNECKNMLKSRKRSMFRFYNDADVSELDEHTQIESDDMNPVDFSEISEVRDELMCLMDKLPELQRQVISMYYYEQNSIDEIAARLGCSSGTVKSRLNYAKKKLKSLVCEYETINNTTLRCGFLFSLVQSIFGFKQALLATSTAVAAVAACCTGVVVYENSVPKIKDTSQPVAEVEYAPAEIVTSENISAEYIETLATQPAQTEAQTVAETEVETTAPETSEPIQTTAPEPEITEKQTSAETVTEAPLASIVLPVDKGEHDKDNRDSDKVSDKVSDKDSAPSFDCDDTDTDRSDNDGRNDWGSWGWNGGCYPQMMRPPYFFWWNNFYGCNGNYGNWNNYYYGIPEDRDHGEKHDENLDENLDENKCEEEKSETSVEDAEDGVKSESENCPFDSDHIH